MHFGGAAATWSDTQASKPPDEGRLWTRDCSVPRSNMETFAATPHDFSMADIHQQTMALSAQYRQVGQQACSGAAGASGEPERPWQEPRRVGATSSGSAKLSSPNVAQVSLQSLVSGSDVWGSDVAQTEARQPVHMQQVGPCLARAMDESAGDVERQQQLQAEQRVRDWHHAAAAAATSAAGPGEVQADAPFGPAWGSGWAPQQAAQAMPSEEPFDTQERVDVLNQYIRQQAHEFLEGQAEFGRQIAEVRAESLREVEMVMRSAEKPMARSYG
jgi:hypothetical protein